MTTKTGGLRGRLLGTGTSTGIPVIGCECRVCTSPNPRDRRLRCSCYLEIDGIHILIDAGPDFRQQALKYGIRKIDAVLITHHHFDHVVGLDDLRPFLFENRRHIPCFAASESAKVLRGMFSYIFQDGSYPGVPRLELRSINAEFMVTSRDDVTNSISVVPIPVTHGDSEILGFRIGGFAYLTDANGIPESSLAALSGLDVLILDALRERPHPTHFSIPEAVEVAHRIGARKTWFLHMTHDVLHDETEASLPEGISLGYDGLQFEAQRTLPDRQGRAQ